MAELRKILNSEIMQQILDSFTSLTGIRTAFVDHVSEQIMGNNLNICDFCSKLRKQPGMNEECIKTDTSAFKVAEASKSPFLYKCHAGLWEAVIPLFVRNINVGFLMLGQAKCSDNSNLDWDTLNKVLTSKGSTSGSILIIKQAYESLYEISKDKIEAAVKMLDIISQYVINSKVVDLLDSSPVEKARSYIDKNYLKTISTDLMVAEAGVSASYLSHIFHKELGQTITEYIENCRLKHACDLLRQTDYTIKEISSSSGYDDQNYFSRIFKKRLGISPSKYKELQLEK